MTKNNLSRILGDIVESLTVEEPEAKRALVLSPHPDDDVIGCGGTIAKLVAHGCEVTVLYLTDGRKGDPTGHFAESRLVELREEEAKAACRLLGVKSSVFLRRQDGNLKPDASTLADVTATIRTTEPDAVYHPSFFEGFFHPDHLQTNVILDRVFSTADWGFSCYGYEIYTPIIPNRLVDISAQARLKISAIEQHRTQQRIRTFTKILELNQYRAAILGPLGSTHAEAFLVANPETYIHLFSNFFGESLVGNGS
jgi:LmbE family N-acetylglucosaminyl deacetylase